MTLRMATAIALTLLWTQSFAATVSLEVLGEITETTGTNIGAAVNDPFSFVIEYESNQAGTPVGPSGTRYSATGATSTAGSFALVSEPPPASQPFLTTTLAFGSHSFTADGTELIQPSDVNGYFLRAFASINLFDDTATALSSNSLPTSLDLNDWTTTLFNAVWVGRNASGAFSGTAKGVINSATFTNSQLSPVPLPAAVWLFITGLAGLIGFSRKRATNAVPKN